LFLVQATGPFHHVRVPQIECTDAAPLVFARPGDKFASKHAGLPRGEGPSPPNVGQIKLFDGVNNPYVRTDSSIVSIGWKHLVGVRSSGFIYLYLDGKLKKSSADNTGSLDTSGLTWSIGRRADSQYGGYFNGQIDDVRIYNYALTLIQIKTLYNSGAVNFGP
jgi:hypothetical protein